MRVSYSFFFFLYPDCVEHARDFILSVLNEQSVQNICVPDARKYFICCTKHIVFNKYIIANNDRRKYL